MTGPVSGGAPSDSGEPAFGVYLHVPFCATRCGYCDFNTYTAGELGSAASTGTYLDAIARELELGAEALGAGSFGAGSFEAQSPGAGSVGGAGVRPAETVFIGGGTPSLLGASGLARLLDAVRGTFGLAPGAEVTTESNPESTSPEFFEGIREAGFTRVSLGMQSVAPHVLATLDRVHTPGRPVEAAREARAAGFDHVNLDLIYGTPGESMSDLDASLDAVLSAGVDHVSAYSLIVEEGTAMARKVRRGELPMPDDDDLADRYERIDAALRGAGFGWYEVSNWSRPGGECRHNMIYWRDGDWWGAGPGAHSHIGGRRFHNVKHPARYASVVSGGELPIRDSESLSDDDRHIERVMLRLRLAEGMPASELRPGELERARAQEAAGMLAIADGRVRLTDAGRLLADAIIVDILS
ncbi:radical SAM family heme chaperone HemW [Corynebacterium hansenii]|uniref:Heme chaperone HemW n=1 Tax=Corynebacterium hansenii TaxID=394964 RepID=A0ABV7ZR78_9CORY|nr:radical SAM family heme chaperone HemW [Corynebacterium hansenii]WJZ00530.1 Oxygen-independent coproporphyrinogen-III oxidase 1 [Corynebacterium hansenii]